MDLEPRMFINYNNPAQVRKAAIASRVEALTELEELGLLKTAKKKKSTSHLLFDEKKHPRNSDGRFSDVPKSTTTTKSAVLQKINKQVEVIWPDDFDKNSEFKIEEKTPKKPGDKIDGISVQGKVYIMTLPNGKKISLYEEDVQDSYFGDKDHKLSLLRALADMHMLYPNSKTTKIILKSKDKAPEVGSGKAAGWVNPSHTDRINVNINSNEFESQGKSQHLIYHEVGHLYNYNRNKRGQIGNKAFYNSGPANALYNNKGLRKYTTDYGKTKPGEAYAENFQEWHSSRGMTRNVAAIAYARSQKWYGYNNPVYKPPPPSSSSKATKPPSPKSRSYPALSVDDNPTPDFISPLLSLIDSSLLEDGGFIVADSFHPRVSIIIGKVPETAPTAEEIAEVEEIVSKLLKEIE